jgi:NADH-quinone oxidoreductase subunit L
VAQALSTADTVLIDGAVMAIGRGGLAVARGIGFADRRGVDGAVNGVAGGTLALGRLFKKLQTGVTANYALLMIVLGVAIFYVAWWMVR